jgi:acyl carrier protein
VDSVKDKLARCFAVVFPELDPSLYATAAVDTISGWDSLAHVTLLTVIAEEFEREVDFEAFEDATSFEALTAALQLQ